VRRRKRKRRERRKKRGRGALYVKFERRRVFPQSNPHHTRGCG
jgi:hypothetical protein